jgi:integrase
MTLKLRGGVYQIDITVSGSPRYRTSTGTRDKGIAQAQHAQVERALRLGLPLASGKDPEGVTLGALFDRAVRMHWRGSKGLQTVLQHRAAILSCIPATTPVAALSGRLDALVAALHARPGLHAGNRAPATINRILQTLRKALGLAVEWGYLDRAPKLPRYREPSGRIRVYDAAEEAAILGFFDAQDPALARLTRILLATGFRLSEVLRRDQIVLGPGSVTVWDTKTGGGRTVPVSPEVGRLCAEHVSGPPLNKDNVEWRWRRMREALGLGDDAVIHALRHTCCTRLIRGGMALPKVMLWMGHRDVHTTMRYTHMAVADLVEGVALVSGT